MNQLIERTGIILLTAFFPLFFVGIINRVKARWAGKKGPSVFQPFFDVARLLKKGAVVSTTSSFILAMAPSVSLAAVLCAAAVVPAGVFPSIISFKGDFIFFSAMFGLSKYLMILNAMDTGSSFEGMGASREASFTALVEPSFYLILASIAYLSGYTSLSGILTLFNAQGSWSVILIMLTATALFIMLLLEGCRVPVDDPTTHLELTMIHEVMALDNSGPDLAFITYTAGLKLYLVAAIIASLIVPAGLSFALGTALFAAIVIGLAILTGIVESLRPRLRMIHVPEVSLLMLSVALLICAGIIIYRNGVTQ
ncbi:MAG TPA: NADH-quinone oxidoreductase subunit H [Spirochaetota bacterium]|nr:NADH-quinone oxidoreductase subunit H [Spirochaetota bacterium]